MARGPAAPAESSSPTPHLALSSDGAGAPSLERRLPLYICGLLIVTLGLAMIAGYRATRATAIDTTTGHLLKIVNFARQRDSITQARDQGAPTTGASGTRRALAHKQGG